MNVPVLSFIIPVYKKTPETFRRCLESLFAMTFKDIEVVCAFDGHDEDLEKVAAGFTVKSVVLEHGGASKARNEGFKLSTGRYVAFWDADCFAKIPMAKRWIDEFDATAADFVYSGYEFEDEGGGFASEPFSPYSLTCGNYIATMFPMKREVFPGFDESLKAAQDWDLWLTVVENGGKGAYIEGYGWTTEKPKQGSISFDGWGPQQRDKTIDAVRQKHGIPNREILFSSMRYNQKCIELAKLCSGDVLKGSGYGPERYDLIFNLGYGPGIRFDGAKKGAVKIHYWLPWDVECLFGIAYKTAKETIRLAKEEITVSWVGDIYGQKKLAELGIDAKVVALPIDAGDAETSLPSKFRVLVDTDPWGMQAIPTLKTDLPHIEIDYLSDLGNAADISTYSLYVSFHEFPSVDEGLRRAMLNGRHIISNVQSPYCGYIDMSLAYEPFKREIIRRIHAARELPFNSEAKKYAMDSLAPEKFKSEVYAMLPVIRMEVL